MGTKQNEHFFIKSERIFEDFNFIDANLDDYCSESSNLKKSELYGILERCPVKVFESKDQDEDVKLEPTETIYKKHEITDEDSSVDVDKDDCSLIEKMFLVHEVEANRLFCCTLCSYKTHQKSDVIRHFRTHSKEKPFACDLCPYKSSQKCNLQKHINTHNGDKPFKCNICSSKFTRKCSLTRHLGVHETEKPFKCKLCDCKYAQKTRLYTHMKIHNGVKSYTCKICQYATSHSKSHLNRHMKTHYKENGIIKMK